MLTYVSRKSPHWERERERYTHTHTHVYFYVEIQDHYSIIFFLNSVAFPSRSKWVNQFHDLHQLTRKLVLPRCHTWNREIIMLININLIIYWIYCPASAVAKLKLKKKLFINYRLTLARFLIWLIAIWFIYIQKHKSIYQNKIHGRLFCTRCMFVYRSADCKSCYKKTSAVGFCRAEVEVK